VLTKTSTSGARAALDRLRRSGLAPREYLHEVSALVRRTVPHDVSGWMTLDPDTMLPTGTVEAQKSPNSIAPCGATNRCRTGREAEQVERLRHLAKDVGLDPAFAEKFLTFLIEEVLRHHRSIAETGTHSLGG
jgi:hypothetical protein